MRHLLIPITATFIMLPSSNAFSQNIKTAGNFPRAVAAEAAIPTVTQTPTSTPPLPPQPTPTPVWLHLDVTVTDTQLSYIDLSNGTDEDPAEDRQLVIRWTSNRRDPNVEYFGVYVSVNYGMWQYLGQTDSADATYFEWGLYSPLTEGDFIFGPLFGRSYQFAVYALLLHPPPGTDSRLYGTFENAGPVAFVEEVRPTPSSTPTPISTPTPSRFTPADPSSFVTVEPGFQAIDAYKWPTKVTVEGEEVKIRDLWLCGRFLDSSRGILVGQDEEYRDVIILFDLQGPPRIVARTVSDGTAELCVLGFFEGVLLVRLKDTLRGYDILIRITGDWGKGIEVPTVIPSPDLNQDGKIDAKDLFRFQRSWHRR